MAVAYDAYSASGAPSADTLSWTHTPVGTPRGVLVLIVDNAASSNAITSVTYGGTAMTAVNGSPVAHTTGSEDGYLYAYFLGASIPTGAQTVEVTESTATSKSAACYTVTAGGDTHASSAGVLDSGGMLDPSTTVSLGTGDYFVAAALHSGTGSLGTCAPLAGFTTVDSQDFGLQTCYFVRKDAVASGSVTVGWDSSGFTEEAGIIAVGIVEGLLTLALDRAEETDTARDWTVRPILDRATETDTSRAILPLTANWPAFSGTRTFIPLSTSSIDSTLSGASSGTVFVLTNQPRPTSTGIEAYTWTSSLPAGVTLRGNPVDAVGQSVTKITWVVTSTVAIGDDCTLRDMFLFGLVSTSFSFSGKAWFENCVMGNTVTDAPPSSSSDYVIFSRCTFMSTGDIPLFDDDGVSAGGYYFYDCLFLDNRTSGTSPLIKTFAGDITFVNCTFSTTVTDWLDAAPGATGTVTFTNCVFAGEITDITSLGGVSGSSNWGVTSPALSIGQTTVTNLYLDDSNYWRLTPTNQSPFRAGGTTTARTHAGAMTLDRDCLPYAASTPSAGCFQWKPASSCLYKARSSDPLDGFEFTYGANTLDTTYLSEFSPTLFKSHLDVAAVVRSYVWDLIHPARGYFYTTWDGYYRLFLHAGRFDLTTASPSSKIFGATTLTAEEDTG